MRQFVVLGYKTTSNSEQGELIHLGSDREKALTIVEAQEAGLARKALFELALPHKQRHFEASEAPKKKRTKEA